MIIVNFYNSLPIKQMKANLSFQIFAEIDMNILVSSKNLLPKSVKSLALEKLDLLLKGSNFTRVFSLVNMQS